MQVELKVRSIRCVSRADGLPFELADAMRSEEELKREDAQYSTVQQDTRLENRWIDLRTPVNQAIFRVQSAVCQVSLQKIVQADADAHGQGVPIGMWSPACIVALIHCELCVSCGF